MSSKNDRDLGRLRALVQLSLRGLCRDAARGTPARSERSEPFPPPPHEIPNDQPDQQPHRVDITSSEDDQTRAPVANAYGSTIARAREARIPGRRAHPLSPLATVSAARLGRGAHVFRATPSGEARQGDEWAEHPEGRPEGRGWTPSIGDRVGGDPADHRAGVRGRLRVEVSLRLSVSGVAEERRAFLPQYESGWRPHAICLGSFASPSKGGSQSVA